MSCEDTPVLKGADNQIDNDSDNEVDNEIDKRELVLDMLKGAVIVGLVCAAGAGGLYMLSYGNFVSMGLETGRTILFGLGGMLGGAALGAFNQTKHIPAQAIRNTTDYCVDGVCKLADRVLPAPKKKRAKQVEQQPEAAPAQPPTNATRGADEGAPKNPATVINNYFQAAVGTVYAADRLSQPEAAVEKIDYSNSSARTRPYTPRKK